jgi:hypothetical protein
MSKLTEPTNGLIIGSVLYRKDLHSITKMTRQLSEKFGDYVIYNNSFFPMKDYYSKEMGESSSLDRFFIVFVKNVKREEMVSAKLWAQDLEDEYLCDSARSVNFDIGLLTLENLVLATGKNFSHRPYLGSGVFADLTLIRKANEFVTTPWTYPDYSNSQVINFFDWSRQFIRH